MSDQVSWMVYATNWLFFLYFAVLFVERIQSVVRSFRKGKPFADGLGRYMYGLTFVSMAGTLVLLLWKNWAMFAGLFTNSASLYERLDFAWLSIAVGCLLFCGMVHTEYTIPGLQFGAYGALAVAMILRTVEQIGAGQRPLEAWITFAFILAYSMAIPVVYPSEIAHKKVFHIVEAAVSFCMVIVFTLMLAGMFGLSLISPFWPGFMIFALAGDIAVLSMRWKEYVNSFVLIFLVLSVGLWIAGMVVGV